MTNEERRTALNEARKNAYRHALKAELLDPKEDSFAYGHAANLATMWSAVAEAMKDGDPVHDGPDGRPIDGSILHTEYGVISR